MSMVNTGEIWGLDILSKLQGILHGKAALPFLSSDMIRSISDESVGGKKMMHQVLSQDSQVDFFCSGDF